MLKDDWPIWKDNHEAQNLSKANPGLDEAAFDLALQREMVVRWGQFQDGIMAYRRASLARKPAQASVLWRDGTSRLLDYRVPGSNGPGVLVIPSLVNRASILDGVAGKSFLRFLADKGLRPLMLDWGAPGTIEKRFDANSYIVNRVCPAIDMAGQIIGDKPILLGYCMGGNLAVAGACLKPDLVKALVAIATPWDFHAGLKLAPWAEAAIGWSDQTLGYVSVDVLGAFFAGLNPLGAAAKFTKFSQVWALANGQPGARPVLGLDGADQAKAWCARFVRLEDWLNDGVPLATPVARQCLTRWYGDNDPGRGAWKIDGQIISLANFGKASLVVVPSNDRIVPPLCAAALAKDIPQAQVMTPDLGHIGLMVSQRAPDKAWGSMVDWLLAVRG